MVIGILDVHHETKASKKKKKKYLWTQTSIAIASGVVLHSFKSKIFLLKNFGLKI